MNVQGLSHDAHPTWTTQATQGTCLSLDDERAERASEIFLGRSVFDETVGIHPSAAEEFVTMREKTVRPAKLAAD